jgi:hypothetical protein
MAIGSTDAFGTGLPKPMECWLCFTNLTIEILRGATDINPIAIGSAQVWMTN